MAAGSDKPVDPALYLGWEFTGERIVGRRWATYAFSDPEGETRYRFSVAARSAVHAAAAAEAVESARNGSLAVARAKIFLDRWEDGRDYSVIVSGGTPNSALPTRVVAGLIARALHRLRERGTVERDVLVDREGLALELGIPLEKVFTAASDLSERGFIDIHPGELMSLRAKGAEWVESTGQPLHGYIAEVLASVLGRLDGLRVGLGAELQGLSDSVVGLGGGDAALKGFAAGVRDFVQGLTDALCVDLGVGTGMTTAETVKKVRAIAGLSSSRRRGSHLAAIADVMDSHMRAFNGVLQRGVHERAERSQRLFLYALLLTADLLDVAQAARSEGRRGEDQPGSR